jgi:hypothetical protein
MQNKNDKNEKAQDPRPENRGQDTEASSLCGTSRYTMIGIIEDSTTEDLGELLNVILDEMNRRSLLLQEIATETSERLSKVSAGVRS